tara:strand:+ start:152 stop:337 length:186 start_codon:yes stop_codon:yes gene_type:complete
VLKKLNLVLKNNRTTIENDVPIKKKKWVFTLLHIFNITSNRLNEHEIPNGNTRIKIINLII